nr:hypothetical protein GCM10020092_038710 [Actinoplanes digitatis]
MEIHTASTSVYAQTAATARGFAEPTARHGPAAAIMAKTSVSVCLDAITATIADTVTTNTAMTSRDVDENITRWAPLSHRESQTAPMR